MAKPRNTWYRFNNAANGEPAKLTIEGEIGDWGVSSKDFRESFARLGESEPVSLHIASGGGSIFDGQEIANIIRGHKGAVSCTLGSIVASIATVIACAAETVTASKNTIYMIHRASAFAGGDADDMRKTAEIMEKLEKGIVQAYVDKTGMEAEKLAEMMDEETWMDAEEAKLHGFVDAIDDEDAEDEVVDTVNLRNYKNSATLLSRLHIEPAENGVMAGNGQRLTLQAIRNAAKPPVAQPPVNQPISNSVPKMKTAEEIAAEKAQKEEINRLAKEEAVNIVKAQKVRSKEIRDMVNAIAARDNKDFSDLADEFVDADKTPDEFARALIVSNKFKPKEIVGSGIQLVEPLDGYKGTPGYEFVNSEGFKAITETIKRRGGSTAKLPVNISVNTNDFRNVQTSTATSGSGLTSIEKLPGVIELGVRPLTVEDLISGGQTSNTTVRYIQEVTYTEAAASVAETGALPQLTMTYTEVDAAVKDIGGYVKMSENLLADYAAVASFINMRLPYQVDRAVEDQLLNGDGSGTNITGILNSSGVQTLALGANTRSDLALKLQTLVRWQNMTAGQAQGGFEPDGYIVHPTDWETLVLTKDSNGQYLCRGPFTGSYGNVAEQGSVGSIVEFYTLWGKKVAISPVVAQGTIVCGAWKMGAQKFDRQGLIIEMSNSDGSDFLSRIVTLRGTRRLALCVYRPGSFATGTGV